MKSIKKKQGAAGTSFRRPLQRVKKPLGVRAAHGAANPFGGKGVSLFRQDQSPGPGWMTFPMFQVLATRRAASSRSSAVR